MAASSRARTHSALASPSRVQLLDHIRAAEEPLDAHRLAQECDLHVTTVRFHLDALISAGLISSRTAPASGRGRPRLLYFPVAQMAHAQEDPYVELSRLLVTALQQPGGSTVERAEAAGYQWAVESMGPAADAPEGPDAAEQAPPLRDVAARVNALFTELGFESEFDSDEAAADMTLHACPFGALAKENSAVICRIHLGLLRGALDRLGARDDSAEVQPWVTPTLCHAVIGRGQAARKSSASR